MNLYEGLSPEIADAVAKLEQVLGRHDPYPQSTQKMFRWEHLPQGLVVNLHRENQRVVCLWVGCDQRPHNLRRGRWLQGGPDGQRSVKNANHSARIRARTRSTATSAGKWPHLRRRSATFARD